jgi:hypothetical protein
MRTPLYLLLSAFVLCLMWAGTLTGTPTAKKSVDGEQVYKANCTRCHNTPPALNERQARVVVSHMRVRANLSSGDANAVLLYLAENAR